MSHICEVRGQSDCQVLQPQELHNNTLFASYNWSWPDSGHFLHFYLDFFTIFVVRLMHWVVALNKLPPCQVLQPQELHNNTLFASYNWSWPASGHLHLNWLAATPAVCDSDFNFKWIVSLVHVSSISMELLIWADCFQVMSLAQSDVRKYSENEEFVPSEVLIVEWNSVTPYPASNNAESQVS